MNDRTDDSALRVLLDVVQRDLEQRRRSALDDARGQARQIVQGARATARQRVHQAIGQERARLREEVERSSAAHAIRARERRQQAARAMLGRAWNDLPEALRAEWSDPEGRRRWVTALWEQAQRALLPGPLRVEHPADWNASDHADLVGAMTDWSGGAPELVADPALDAGLRIHGGGAVLDGSVAGLLADRRAVEGRLLAELLSEEAP